MITNTSVQQHIFNRSWAVTIGPKGGEGSKYTQLRTVFDIDKNSTGSSNKAKIEIYNLQAYSRQQFQKGYIIQLDAGYYGMTETLYLGDITRSESKRHGAEIVTSFECGDAERQLVYAHFDKSYPAGTKFVQVIQDAANTLNLNGVSTGTVIGIQNQIFGNGFSFSGTVKSLLNKLLPKQGLEWSIQNGYLQIIPVTAHNGDTAILISNETGLVGVPSQGVGFVQFQCLLNPKILPGCPVAVKSETVNGVFKVRRAHIIGDSHSSNKWTIDCEAVRINATQVFISNQGNDFRVIG